MSRLVRCFLNRKFSLGALMLDVYRHGVCGSLHRHHLKAKYDPSQKLVRSYSSGLWWLRGKIRTMDQVVSSVAIPLDLIFSHSLLPKHGTTQRGFKTVSRIRIRKRRSQSCPRSRMRFKGSCRSHPNFWYHLTWKVKVLLEVFPLFAIPSLFERREAIAFRRPKWSKGPSIKRIRMERTKD